MSNWYHTLDTLDELQGVELPPSNDSEWRKSFVAVKGLEWFKSLDVLGNFDLHKADNKTEERRKRAVSRASKETVRSAKNTEGERKSPSWVPKIAASWGKLASKEQTDGSAKKGFKEVGGPFKAITGEQLTRSHWNSLTGPDRMKWGKVSRGYRRFHKTSVGRSTTRGMKPKDWKNIKESNVGFAGVPEWMMVIPALLSGGARGRTSPTQKVRYHDKSSGTSLRMKATGKETVKVNPQKQLGAPKGRPTKTKTGGRQKADTKIPAKQNPGESLREFWQRRSVAKQRQSVEAGKRGRRVPGESVDASTVSQKGPGRAERTYFRGKEGVAKWRAKGKTAPLKPGSALRGAATGTLAEATRSATSLTSEKGFVWDKKSGKYVKYAPSLMARMMQTTAGTPGVIPESELGSRKHLKRVGYLPGTKEPVYLNEKTGKVWSSQPKGGAIGWSSLKEYKEQYGLDPKSQKGLKKWAKHGEPKETTISPGHKAPAVSDSNLVSIKVPHHLWKQQAGSQHATLPKMVPGHFDEAKGKYVTRGKGTTKRFDTKTSTWSTIKPTWKTRSAGATVTDPRSSHVRGKGGGKQNIMMPMTYNISSGKLTYSGGQYDGKTSKQVMSTVYKPKQPKKTE